MMIPSGAKAIIDARRRGMKPADMIIVSLIGPVDEANPTVLANPGSEYDWRWSVGLKICVFVDQKTADKAKSVLLAIGRERPDWLALWHVDRYEGGQAWVLPTVASIDKPKSLWQYALTYLSWEPLQSTDFARMAP